MWMSFWYSISTSFGYVPEAGFLDPMVIVSLIWGNFRLFFMGADPIYIPSIGLQGSLFSIFSLTFAFVCVCLFVLDSSPSNRYLIFGLESLMTSDVEYFFIYFLSI